MLSNGLRKRFKMEVPQLSLPEAQRRRSQSSASLRCAPSARYRPSTTHLSEHRVRSIVVDKVLSSERAQQSWLSRNWSMLSTAKRSYMQKCLDLDRGTRRVFRIAVRQVSWL